MYDVVASGGNGELDKINVEHELYSYYDNNKQFFIGSVTRHTFSNSFVQYPSQRISSRRDLRIDESPWDGFGFDFAEFTDFHLLFA